METAIPSFISPFFFVHTSTLAIASLCHHHPSAFGNACSHAPLFAPVLVQSYMYQGFSLALFHLSYLYTVCCYLFSIPPSLAYPPSHCIYIHCDIVPHRQSPFKYCLLLLSAIHVFMLSHTGRPFPFYDFFLLIYLKDSHIIDASCI